MLYTLSPWKTPNLNVARIQEHPPISMWYKLSAWVHSKPGWHCYKKQRNLKNICQVILFCVCFNQITKCGPCQHSHTSIGRTSANRQMNHFVVITAHGKPMDETCLCTSGTFSLKMNITTLLSTLEIKEETQTN